MFDRLAEWVVSVIEALGYVGLTFLVALESIFPPIPSEIILPLAGFLTGQGRFSFALVLIATTIGSVLGALVLYGVGAAIGPRRVRRLVQTYGKWALLSEQDLDRAETWFDRFGPIAVFSGRLAPIVRSLVSIPAGYRRMPLGQFVLLTAAGSGLWNGSLVALGWLFGDNWHVIERYVGWLQYLVIVAAAVIVVRFVWTRLQARRSA